MNVFYMDKDETYDPAGCGGTETLMMNAWIGLTNTTSVYDDKFDYKKAPFPFTGYWSAYGVALLIDAPDLTFGFGTDEDLTWLRDAVPSGSWGTKEMSRHWHSRIYSSII
jgi:hypothetical protein